MLKKYKLPGLIFLIGAATLAVLVLARPTPEPAPPADESAHVKVAVAPARKESLRLAVTAHGTVMPRREIDLVAQVSGQIVSVEPVFVNGGFFSRSQLLVQIDDRDYHAALLNAKARLAEARRVLAEEEGRSRVAEREWRELGNREANELFVRKPHLAAAKAAVASAEADVASAQLDLERTKIVAPFDGRVRQTYADLGQFVTAGTRLATVYDSTVVEVRLPLTEKQAALIDLPLTAEGAAAPSDGEPAAPGVGVPVTIKGSVAGESHQWQGVLARTDAFVDADSRLYYAVVEVQDPFVPRDGDGNRRPPLLPGLFVEAEIGGKRIDDVIVLPRSALFQLDKIVTIDGENQVGYRVVDVLQKTDSKVWVKAAIADDTLVALEKQSLTPEGSTVEPLLNKGGGTDPAGAAAVATAAKE